MSVIVELSIFPVDKGASVGPYVARALDIIRASGLPYVPTPMATCIEGDWPAVMAVVDRCFKELATDSERVYLNLKADYRKGRTAGLQQKIAAVEKKPGRG